MKAAKRYLLLLFAFILIVTLWLTVPSLLFPWKGINIGRGRATPSSAASAASATIGNKNTPSRSFSDVEDVADDVDIHISPRYEYNWPVSLASVLAYVNRMFASLVLLRRSVCRVALDDVIANTHM